MVLKRSSKFCKPEKLKIEEFEKIDEQNSIQTLEEVKSNRCKISENNRVKSDSSRIGPNEK